MPWFKRKYASKKDLEVLDSKLTTSFSNIKKHNENIFEWLDYFNTKITEQQQTISNQNQTFQNIDQKISKIPLMEYELKRIRESQTETGNMLSNVSELREKLSQVIHNQYGITNEITSINQKMEKPKSKTFKQKLIKKISKNSRKYIKTITINLIHKYENISALKLREIIVEEQGLCSKSAFYRLLSNIEKEEDIEIANHGQEKIYISKLIKRVQ